MNNLKLSQICLENVTSISVIVAEVYGLFDETIHVDVCKLEVITCSLIYKY